MQNYDQTHHRIADCSGRPCEGDVTHENPESISQKSVHLNAASICLVLSIDFCKTSTIDFRLDPFTSSSSQFPRLLRSKLCGRGAPCELRSQEGALRWRAPSPEARAGDIRQIQANRHRHQTHRPPSQPPEARGGGRLRRPPQPRQTVQTRASNESRRRL